MFGIYSIRHKATGKIYIGSTIKSFDYRKKKHFNKLKYNKHHNIKLQRAYNKYGKDAFEFCILEILNNISDVRQAEQYYIDVFYGKHCYNINKKADSPNASLGGIASAKIQKNKDARKTKSTEARQKQYICGFRSPENILYAPVINLRDFSRTHNLHSSHMAQVYNGKRTSHKGWIRG